MTVFILFLLTIEYKDQIVLYFILENKNCILLLKWSKNEIKINFIYNFFSL